MLLSVSYLSLKDKNKIKDLVKEDIDYLHLDIMDGKYVPNKTLPFFKLKKYLKNINKPFDVHLMVNNVLKYIKKYEKLNPEIITFHLDNNSNIEEIIKYLKNKKIKIGIAIKPNEDIDIIKPYLNDIDLILIMSVEPGKGGQQFIENVLNKIPKIKDLDNTKIIEIDGGINNTNINKCNKCDMVVVGSYITNGNFKKQISNLKLALNSKK